MKANSKPALNIASYAKISPENLFSAIAFAVISAQANLMNTVNATKLVREWVERNGMVKPYAAITQEEKSLCGTGISPRKIESLTYLWVNRQSIYDMYMKTCDMEKGYLVWWNYCMDTLSGMGMVKAAFCTQLVHNEMGCIDTHNARELNIKMPTGKSKIGRDRYLTIQAVKSSESWWCDWCDFIAEKYPHLFRDGMEVSHLHQHAIMG